MGLKRLKAYAEIGLLCSVMPIGSFFGIWALWKILLWSYGGREEFRRQVLVEPYEKEWFMVNPKEVFYRRAPLSNIPQQIPKEIDALCEMPQGQAMPQTWPSGEHPHTKNW